MRRHIEELLGRSPYGHFSLGRYRHLHHLASITPYAQHSRVNLKQSSGRRCIMHRFGSLSFLRTIGDAAFPSSLGEGSVRKFVASIALPSLCRYLSSNNAPVNDLEDASLVLKSLHGVEFQPRLEVLRQESPVISWKTLLQEFQRGVPSATESEAQRICHALAEGGVLLRRGNLAYLRPRDVAEALQRILPVDVEAMEERLLTVKSQLIEMDAEYQLIRDRAARRAKLMDYGLFAAMAGQWSVLFRLTYWELSWDVIEPAGFFVGGATTLMSMAYFLKTRRDFTYEVMHDRIISKYEKSLFEKKNFDIGKYRRLKVEAERLQASLDAAKDASCG